MNSATQDVHLASLRGTAGAAARLSSVGPATTAHLVARASRAIARFVAERCLSCCRARTTGFCSAQPPAQVGATQVKGFWQFCLHENWICLNCHGSKWAIVPIGFARLISIYTTKNYRRESITRLHLPYFKCQIFITRNMSQSNLQGLHNSFFRAHPIKAPV